MRDHKIETLLFCADKWISPYTYFQKRGREHVRQKIDGYMKKRYQLFSMTSNTLATSVYIHLSFKEIWGRLQKVSLIKPKAKMLKII